MFYVIMHAYSKTYSSLCKNRFFLNKINTVIITAAMISPTMIRTTIEPAIALVFVPDFLFETLLT